MVSNVDYWTLYGFFCVSTFLLGFFISALVTFLDLDMSHSLTRIRSWYIMAAALDISDCSDSTRWVIEHLRDVSQDEYSFVLGCSYWFMFRTRRVLGEFQASPGLMRFLTNEEENFD